VSRAPDAAQRLRDLLAANRRGERAGVTSICSAEPFVLQASAERATRGGGLLCIESTANQVNQNGGYTGMTPAAFRDGVAALTAAAGLPADRLILGGDHLGPYPWRELSSAAAMAAARRLVRDCVLAGYAKLHLDASMACADDPGGAGGPVDDETATARTVDLCRAAEAARDSLPDGAPAPFYVIGTEVPAPGGEVAGGSGPRVTPVADVERTLTLARDGFMTAGMEDAWDRVVAVVVQPGVEFGDDTVADYEPAAARELSDYLRREWSLVYEAHSTDYQTPDALANLVGDGFGILKVGPWLTYAFREALFALECIERDWLGGRRGVELSDLRATLDGAMVAEPHHWAPYYGGDPGEQRLKRAFSYSDRCRYYWPRPAVRAARDRLLANLARARSGEPVPPVLLSQYLPDQYEAVRSGTLANEPAALVRDRIGRVLALYDGACGAS
jgi:D-tagatose-1,6-bisphosphate aldolase subunit GatZ/KbaZ